MTSEPTNLYVWVWLPDATEPVVAGRLRALEGQIEFIYARSYLNRQDAISLYEPELPLRSGWTRPPDGMSIFGCVKDASPDAWGQRVILRRRLDTAKNVDTAELSILTYLLESASDRIGALDFQESPTKYVARTSDATLNDMVNAAERLDRGQSLTPELDAALFHGTSVGGARPKVTLRDTDKSYIAKLSSTSDQYPVVKTEGAAMLLARRCGLDVANVRVATVLGKDVLLVERFDRSSHGGRHFMVSALTLRGLDENFGRYATYWELAQDIRKRFTEPQATQTELFSRITYNICVSNTDDHARNHSAFWDGQRLTLTPAYDVCPSPRSGGETVQAMAIGQDGWRYSQLAGCLERCHLYGLTTKAAKEIIDHQVDTIRADWSEVADEARLTEADRRHMWERQILNPYCLYDYPKTF